jgi:hypothetical protein
MVAGKVSDPVGGNGMADAGGALCVRVRNSRRLPW